MLEDRLGSLAKIERDLEDAATLVELGEAEGDQASEAEGIAALRGLKAEGERRQLEACSPAKRTRMTHISKCILAQAAPKAATGQECFCECTCAGRSGESSKSS